MYKLVRVIPCAYFNSARFAQLPSMLFASWGAKAVVFMRPRPDAWAGYRVLVGS